MLDIYTELKWRSLIHQVTDTENIQKWLLEKPRTLYTGFDPTAESLHIGHFVPIMGLRRFQRSGHRPIAVLGGATGTIGDPSGKSEERNLITVEDVKRNIAGIRRQMERFLDFDDKENGAILIDNADWMREYRYLDFLRDVGKHFPVNVMLGKDSVKLRLENTDSGLSYTEFSYMLLQSYDFVHLHRTYNCELQLGGSDQWGNITAGIDLARRMDRAQLYGMTYPLLTKSDGKKMGKTESGTLWLDANRTSPYHFFQYWINLEDADVGSALKILTELSQPVIEESLAEHAKDASKRIAQRLLAEDLTRFVHGEHGLYVAQAATNLFFGGEISRFSDADLMPLFADCPNGEITREAFASGYSVIDAIFASGLAKNKSDSRRTIEQGGAYINNKPVKDINGKLSQEDLTSETMIVLRSGKKRYALLRIV